MDFQLIHADEALEEIGEITAFRQFDAVISADNDSDCDWMLELPAESWKQQPVLAGHHIYISGSEWGGPAERVRHSTGDGTVRVYGTCWRGLLRRRAICPAAGETHVVYDNMDANDILRSMTEDWMTTRIAVYNGESGIRCSGKVRYRDMLEAASELIGTGGRLRVRFDGGMIRLWAEPIVDYSNEIELSQEYECSLISERKAAQYDHIVALGQGEMLERMVAELWLLPDGTVTEDSTANGAVGENRSRTLIYEYTAAETREGLVSNAAQKLLGYAGGDGMEIVVNEDIGGLELGDMVSVRDKLTGMTAVLAVKEKNLNISPDTAAVKHKLKQRM